MDGAHASVAISAERELAKRRDGANEFRRKYREAVDAGILLKIGYNSADDAIWFYRSSLDGTFLIRLPYSLPELVAELVKDAASVATGAAFDTCA